MSPDEKPDAQRRVVIAGAGVAGLEAMLALRDAAGDRVALTLISPDEDFTYRPLATAEPFAVADVAHYSVARLAGDHGAELVTDVVAGVDPQRHVVQTRDAGELTYDTLIVALGATRRVAYEEALTFRGERDVPGYRDLLEALKSGSVTRIAFLVPPGMVWPFPLYELALMTGTFAAEHGVDAELTLVTPASGPLALFGEEANAAMSRMLADRGITVITGNQVRTISEGRAQLDPDGDVVHADRFVALPTLEGPRLPGLPHDTRGFIPTDDHGRVEGAADVYAAGDSTTYPVKQGGLAAQQADAVAAAIAAEVGAADEPPPFRPVLRGLLLTGEVPRFLRTEGVDGRGGGPVSDQPLWWPPSKIAGRYLAPALGAIDSGQVMPEAEGGAVPVSVTLERAEQLRDSPPPADAG